MSLPLEICVFWIKMEELGFGGVLGIRGLGISGKGV
jgi:hypothetical protein